MRSGFYIALLCFVVAVTVSAQNKQSSLLTIGDTAPPLRISEWIKGTPVQQFEKGHVYVLEFWATWCKPCIAAMPHLSALAREYKDKVTVIGVEIEERKFTSIEKIKAFVDSIGNRMDYHVAVADSNFMVAGWIEAAGEQINGIPRTFVVNAEGKLAWIGHPKDLSKVLPRVVNNNWEITDALSKRNFDRYLKALDDSINYELMNYAGDAKADSALLFINEILKKEPGLKYAPFVAFNTFSSLLKINQHKAYEYGKVVLVTPTYEEPSCDAIINAIEVNSDKLTLLPEIYRLGAEAYKAQIAEIPYPEITNMSMRYMKMADWYWRANDKSKAIDAQEKAIEALKSKKNFSMMDMTALESRLKQFKKL